MVDDNRARTVAQRQGVALDFGVEMEVRVAAVIFDASWLQCLLPETQGVSRFFNAGDNGSIDGECRAYLLEGVGPTGSSCRVIDRSRLEGADEAEVANAHLEPSVAGMDESPDARRGCAHAGCGPATLIDSGCR